MEIGSYATTPRSRFEWLFISSTRFPCDHQPVINGSSYTIQSIFDTLTSIENKKLELCSAAVPGPGFDIWIRRGWRRPCRGSSYRRRRRCRPGSAPRRTPTSPSSSGAAPPPASGPAAPAPPAPFHKQKIKPGIPPLSPCRLESQLGLLTLV